MLQENAKQLTTNTVINKTTSINAAQHTQSFFQNTLCTLMICLLPCRATSALCR